MILKTLNDMYTYIKVVESHKLYKSYNVYKHLKCKEPFIPFCGFIFLLVWKLLNSFKTIIYLEYLFARCMLWAVVIAA
jgi:hypothetical protein